MISFYCDLNIIEWFYNRIKLPDNVILGTHLKTLTIKTVKMENSGHYYCYGLDSGKRPILSEATLTPIGTNILFTLPHRTS